MYFTQACLVKFTIKIKETAHSIKSTAKGSLTPKLISNTKISAITAKMDSNHKMPRFILESRDGIPITIAPVLTCRVGR